MKIYLVCGWSMDYGAPYYVKFFTRNKQKAEDVVNDSKGESFILELKEEEDAYKAFEEQQYGDK